MSTRKRGFNRFQQGQFRPIVAAAWKLHAAENGIDPGNKDLRDAWYSGELVKAVGYNSTKACDQGRDFDAAIAHFEILVGESTHWQQRLEEGDFRRVIWNAFGKRDAKINGEEVTPDYVRGIAQQSLQTETLPPLSTLSKRQLRTLSIALKAAASRS